MAQPIVKWAGGKTQLLDRIQELSPEHFDNYFEPFVGGAAVFLDIASSHHNLKHIVINDINPSLVNMYIQVRDNADALIAQLTQLDQSIPEDMEEAKTHYYASRDEYNALLSSNTFDLQTAAYFIGLNKHCFNGLYRVNSKGLFNI